MFGNIGGCAVFTAVCFIVKLILFYYHERDLAPDSVRQASMSRGGRPAERFGE